MKSPAGSDKNKKEMKKDDTNAKDAGVSKLNRFLPNYFRGFDITQGKAALLGVGA